VGADKRHRVAGQKKATHPYWSKRLSCKGYFPINSHVS